MTIRITLDPQPEDAPLPRTGSDRLCTSIGPPGWLYVLGVIDDNAPQWLGTDEISAETGRTFRATRYDISNLRTRGLVQAIRPRSDSMRRVYVLTTRGRTILRHAYETYAAWLRGEFGPTDDD